ncbi:MAG: IPT/TIG domain-containing protein [Patescibacteria group bacterium]
MNFFTRKPFKLSHGDSSSFYAILSAIFVLISLACIVAIVRIRSAADTTVTPTQTAQAGNTAPSVDAVTPSNLSGSGDISLPDAGLILNEGTTVNLFVRGAISDANGCANIDHAVVTVFRSGATDGENCTPDNNDCYSTTLTANQLTDCNTGGTDNDAAFETSFTIANYADPTDASSQYEDQTWKASVTAYDAGSLDGSFAVDFEMQSLAAFGLSTESINYGSLSLGATSPQQTVTFSNTGNRLVDAYVNADLDMRSNLSGFADILSSAVHYSLSDGFTYNTGDTAVELTQTSLPLGLPQETVDGTTPTKPAYFRLKMPNSGINGTYSNILTFTAFALPFLNDTPTISGLSATSSLVGGETMEITVTGTDFPTDSQVFLGSTQLTAVRNSSNSLTVTIPSSELQNAGTIALTVVNPGTNSTSTPVNFSVLNYPPRFTDISPTTKEQYSGQFTLTLNGDDLLPTSQAKIDGNDVATTYVSKTQLTAVIPSSYIDTLGDHSITITNPTPGGGASVVQTFSVVNALPTLSSITPNSKSIGAAQFTITLTGTGFNASSVVKLGGANRATTYVSPTQLTAIIPASDLAAAGTFDVTVTNPTPGGGTSAAQQLFVGLIHAYHFEEAAGASVLDSVGTMNGINTGSTQVAGVSGYALQTVVSASADNNVGFPVPGILPNGAKTIDFYFKATAGSTPEVIKQGYWLLSIYQNKLDCTFQGGRTTTVRSTTSVADGTWHRLTCSWDGTTNADSMKLYVDNSLQQSVYAQSGEFAPAGSVGAIRKWAWIYSIDELMIYNGVYVPH